MKDVSFQDVMEYVRGMDSRALTSDDFADVIQILDYVREQSVTMQDHLNTMQEQLDKRDAELKAREQALAIRQSAVDMVLKHTPASKPKRTYFWR
jgi:hypothetical protein